MICELRDVSNCEMQNLPMDLHGMENSLMSRSTMQPISLIRSFLKVVVVDVVGIVLKIMATNSIAGDDDGAVISSFVLGARRRKSAG